MKTNGQIAYEGYTGHTGGKSLVSGEPLPLWDDVTLEIKQAWEVAAASVSNVQMGVIVREHRPDSRIKVIDNAHETLGELTPEQIRDRADKLLKLCPSDHRILHQDVIVLRRVFTTVRVLTVAESVPPA